MSSTKNSYVAFRSDGVTSKFCANMSCTKNSYVAFKSDAVASKFCANMSCTKMNVVMIYFYSKRFRFAPSFNNT